MTIKVKVRSETGTSRKPAEVLVYENDHLITKVVAKVELKQGADGEYYNCVTLTKLEGSYSCLLCGTTTPLPHVCPAFYPELRK
ncbi:MAG: hypothetical protein A3B91_01910 [Candidatus Yanofskybacteria bacterium RIFCSPHIGHO2_02_FULL_41_29]|uniref:Uncharacterized protein n=1 Tax=Candidatus Yanofskybacteria bacterium RIFCSPHIGHO2_01_FULL_41_53 TaxID=1802663 RepID=A0A1F8EII0_9BACT|nr:MAG: hypothetical protein A2650_04350 [Candidatus Yanofskybacteria bacterium RIFCSPHIGHO2_01_FULL_41_53]OGN11216.1 MAG: hypothetical protein A3B91_01910 [Candidatus Yanofskybacteria bacterium RIFCSPHIGHO2_02_FULL_41_29]OGN16963.1 MAG: hypothetical protein A3F48_00905 [Candidatus Yanofskybacteria bacterium RIFCSPHIGHO2_12_FULL_41_9]OGN22282.1 MAG: hypothetical protein A2916_04155 [Candidatus Yanofskybacteria bacterium RIFCSPLOWO2_01_FULL_41_67]OGN29650.1 MAG: hypothetical protein A3H54_00795 